MNDLFGSVVVDRSGAEHITVKQARPNVSCEEYISKDTLGDEWEKVSRTGIRCFIFPPVEVLRRLISDKYSRS